MTRALGLFPVLIVGAVALAGCGSSGQSRTTTTPAGRQAPAGAPSGQAFAQLRECLEKHGVSMPGGPPNGSGPPQAGPGQPPKLDSGAFKACRRYLPQGGPGAGAAPPGGTSGGSS